MFWVMRQPTCVFVETVHDSRLRRRLRGLRAQRSPVDSPGGPDRAPRGQDHSRFSCTPPHVPPERSVPCRFAWPLPGGRAVILFKANEKSNDATQAKLKHDARPEPASHRRTCTLSPGHVPAHVSISRRVSVSRSRLAAPARREQARAPRDPPPGRGRGRCAVPPDRTPRRSPRPRDRTASERGCTEGSVPGDGSVHVRTFVPPVTVLFRPYLLYLQYCKYTDVG